MIHGKTAAVGLFAFALWATAISGCAKGVSNAEPFDETDRSPDAAATLPDDTPSSLASADDAALASPVLPIAASSAGTDAAMGSGDFDVVVRDRSDASGDAGDEAPGDADGDDGTCAQTSDDLEDDASHATKIDASLDANVDTPWIDDAGVASDDASVAPPGANVSTASPGDLLITEIMFAPWGPEPQSEWFEIYNTTTLPKLLSGLTLEDGYPRTHVIAVSPPVIAPPETYVVFVRDRALALATGVPEATIAYEYGAGLAAGDGIQLENGATGALSLWNGATELDSVPYGPWGLASYGQSIEVDALETAASANSADWCLAQYPWASGSDDGTPGAANDCP